MAKVLKAFQSPRSGQICLNPLVRIVKQGGSNVSIP